MYPVFTHLLIQNRAVVVAHFDAVSVEEIHICGTLKCKVYY